ncbi:MAG: phage major capsid domain-containing protein [Dolichospermum sp.]
MKVGLLFTYVRFYFSARAAVISDRFAFNPRITTENRPAGTDACNYGVTDALAPFPLHSLVHVMSATIIGIMLSIMPFGLIKIL